MSPPPPAPNPPAVKFTSQSDAHMRTDAQIKFLCYPLLWWVEISFRVDFISGLM